MPRISFDRDINRFLSENLITFLLISSDIVSGLNIETGVLCVSGIIMDFCGGDDAQPVIMNKISKIVFAGFAL